MKIVPYSTAGSELWDALVENSRNGLFQHRRAYMDYHADRFADCSAVAFDDKGRAVAALPAHADGDTVCSHRGLSFGGWLLTGRVDASMMLRIWNEAADYYRAQGFRRLYYRPVPHIFHRYPAEEDLYALFRAGAPRGYAGVVGDRAARAVGLRQQRAPRACTRRKTGLECVESLDYEAYWAILGEVLAKRHGATPVHSLDEIRMLAGRFPANIRLFLVCEQGTPVAGHSAVHKRTHGTLPVHSVGRARLHDRRSLALLFDNIRRRCAADGLAYLDLGTSNENGGRFLNEGLIRQKAGFRSTRGGIQLLYHRFLADSISLRDSM